MQATRAILLVSLGLIATLSQGCGDKKDTDNKGGNTVSPPDAVDKLPLIVDEVTDLIQDADKPKKDLDQKFEFFEVEEGFKWDLVSQLEQENINAGGKINLCLKHMMINKERIMALPMDHQLDLLEIVKSGLIRPDSEVGVYAQRASDYETFDWFLKEIMYDYQNAASTDVHQEGWNLNAGKGFCSRNVCTSTGGDEKYSLRIRVARNFANVPLPAACKEADFRRIEDTVGGVLAQMVLPKGIKNAENFKHATKYTLTKDHELSGQTVKGPQHDTEYIYVNYSEPGQVKYSELKSKAIFPEDPTKDAHLAAGNIDMDMPIGRSTFDLTDGEKTFRVYINEEDAIRVMIMTKGNDVGEIFNDFHLFLETLEHDLIAVDKDFAFARDAKLGYLASCPSNIGTGMRASAKMPIPYLLRKNGYEVDAPDAEKGKEILHEMNAQDILKKDNLQLRGGGGEGSPPGAGGTIDVSYKKRTYVTEAEIALKLIKAMQYIHKLEEAAKKELSGNIRKPSSQMKLTVG